MNAIRYGLAAIKNVGQSAMEAAIRERESGGEFVSLEDFCRRLDSRIANRKMLESLVKCGAFDFLGRERAELSACIDESLAAASSSHKDRASGQVSLFDDMPAATSKSSTRTVIAWTEQERMSFEKELLGFYVTGHPLDAYESLLAAGKYQTIISLGELNDRASFRIAGAIVQVDRKFTKKEGKPFAVVWLEDLTGTLEIVLWNETYMPVAESLQPGRVIAIQGTLDKRDEAVRATAQKVKLFKLEDAKSAAARSSAASEPALQLRFAAGSTIDELRGVRVLLAGSPGTRPVQLVFERPGSDALVVSAGDEFRIQLTPDLENRLAPWLRPSVELMVAV